MEIFRLSRRKHASPLSGIGAAISGARWNSVGVEMIYTASNRSLAMAEVAVHLTLATIPDDFVMVTISVPDTISTKTVSAADLPPDWNTFPYPPSTQTIGDNFIRENEYCILVVPSVVTPGDHNLLINPHHPGFSSMEIEKIEKFPFDNRIFE